jgi:hypothetical protein
MRIKGQSVEGIIGAILPADADITAQTEIDQIRRCSKIEIACTPSSWLKNPSETAGIRM